MSMRSTLWVVASVVGGGLLGCGEQPRYYRVAIDSSSLAEVPASCYRSGSVPEDNDKTNNVVQVGQWIIWDGVEGQKYLQVGAISYPLGDASVTITAGDAIVSTEADKPTFTIERIQTNPNSTARATYTFDSLGETAQGTLSLSYVCSGSAACAPNCEASVPFVGRRLEAEPMLVVSNTANN
ncbi:hypothetical protein ACN28E_06950 [Archangium lansingense]|uniref:hypothetical protein n=1 Tax=Archangium lansingense TaxID=2995310 RepID=UPI003B77C491